MDHRSSKAGLTRLAVTSTHVLIGGFLPSISEAVKRGVKRVGSRLGENPRDEARAVVEGGLGLGNNGD